ncbi:hypothetical protein [Bacillus pseudomycoides]|uniref:hypothetical protein n=1 Tax=Bacillus pseudomycoides TaxID=64104 RepID=UPI000534E5F2|nr:hypothetical protein [Bacillus pseudomycoides]MDR4188525.1 hypothetical protein [Bacillus pseudomycoides]
MKEFSENQFTYTIFVRYDDGVQKNQRNRGKFVKKKYSAKVGVFALAAGIILPSRGTETIQRINRHI